VILSNVLSGDGHFWGRERMSAARRARPKSGWLVGSSAGASAAPTSIGVEEESMEKGQRHFFLVAASTAAAVSWTGVHFLLPPLQLISVPITLAVAFPILRDAIADSRTGQREVAAASIIGVVGSLLWQQTTVAALISVVYYAGEATIRWWRKGDAAQTAQMQAKSISADSDVYLVRCWREEGSDAQPVMRYVLESSNDTARYGFAKLTDLLDALRSKITAPQQVSMPLAVFAI